MLWVNPKHNHKGPYEREAGGSKSERITGDVISEAEAGVMRGHEQRNAGSL